MYFPRVLCSTYIISHLFHVSLLVVFLLYVKSSYLHILKFAYISWRNKTCKNLIQSPFAYMWCELIIKNMKWEFLKAKMKPSMLRMKNEIESWECILLTNHPQSFNGNVMFCYVLQFNIAYYPNFLFIFTMKAILYYINHFYFCYFFKLWLYCGMKCSGI
jgi:hypothetical protein